MAIPDQWKNNLKLPVIAAPMFLVSGVDLVIQACQNGIVGAFPALNQRSSHGFEEWLIQIKSSLNDFPHAVAPYGVNLIVHKSNPRLEADLKICTEQEVPLVITSLGAVKDIVDRVHSYGGLVFHDVTTLRHAEKAAEAGVDGLIAVCAGAGGHAGTLNPFAFTAEIRKWFKKTLVLAGSINHGHQIRAAQELGADLVYMGTRFINTQESLAPNAYKDMILNSEAKDIVYTPAVSGIPANFLEASLKANGLDPNQREKPNPPASAKDEFKAWKSVWSAGQGAGSIDDTPSVADLVVRLTTEYTRRGQD